MFRIESHRYYEDQTFKAAEIATAPQMQCTEFCDCAFVDCKFASISFFDCIFENCTFENCDLASASLKHTSFRDVIFTESKLTGIQWAEATLPLDVHFRRSILNYSGFVGVDMRNAEIVRCQLKEVDFSETNLSKTDCRYSDFSGARFNNTNLSYANFTRATAYSIHPASNILRKTKFSLPEAISFLDTLDIILE
ncbi:MAG: fluoroquinolone resistance protein [Desulforhopalus sp.]|jgi:fluoroquinolone resistance protein